MALNISPKAQPSSAPTTRPNDRPQVSYAPKPSSARAEALKARLTGKPNPQPVAPRRAGSSARAEEYSKLQKYQATPPPVVAPPIGNSSARRAQTAPQTFEAQPSGLAQGFTPPDATPSLAGGTELSQTDNSVETVEAPEVTSKPLSPQFVALAKQEATIRRARQELKAQQDAWKNEQASYVKKSDLTADPIKALAEAGVTYDRLVELQLNQEAPDPNQALHDKIAALEAKLQGVDEQFSSRDKQQYDTAINQIDKDVQFLVDSDPAYETIKATDDMGDKANGSMAVRELILKIFESENTILPVEEAARLVEEKLSDRAYQISERLRNLSKIKTRMAPPAEPDEASPVQQPQTIKSTTLTNNGAVQRSLTARERAILRFKEAQEGK